MSHANARLNIRGRELLMERVCEQGWAVTHAAKAQGVSHQCAHRWVSRFRAEGWQGLADRSSRPHHSPRQIAAEAEDAIVAVRHDQRRGQDGIGRNPVLIPSSSRPPETTSTVAAILASTAGGRKRLLVTSSPTRSRWVWAASADSNVQPFVRRTVHVPADLHEVVEQPGVLDLRPHVPWPSF